jgi:hypothetical protein
MGPSDIRERRTGEKVSSFVAQNPFSGDPQFVATAAARSHFGERSRNQFDAWNFSEVCGGFRRTP